MRSDTEATGDGSGDEVTRLFAAFIEARETDADVDFDAWVSAHPAYEAALRSRYRAWLLVEPPRAARATPDDPDTLPTSAERFEILEELGRGGFGRVLRARDRVLNREVALKLLGEDARVSPEMRCRFLEEARILAGLDHPNIVRIHWVDTRDGEIRLCLERIEGHTLHELVKRDGPYKAEEAALIGVDLCRALAAIHGQGLVHMDLKPGNVMRADGGRIVLLDFGFARLRQIPAGTEGSPRGGTPAFMAPERFEESEDIGPRSDLFSLGALLYWIVAGRYPHDFEGLADLRAKVLKEDPVPLVDRRPDVPRAFAAIVSRAMARREDDRFPSAGAMEEALQAFLTGSGTPPRAAATSPLRRGLLVGAAGTALVVAALFTGRTLLAEAPLDFDCAFYVERKGSDDVAALSEDAEVDVGDKIFLEARGAEPFYLYVFNEDDANHCFRLASGESGVHAGGESIRLPGPDDFWIVTTKGGGAERLFVVAARERVAMLDWLAQETSAPEQRPRSFDQIARGAPAEYRERLRGVGGTTAGEPGAGTQARRRLVDFFEGFDAPGTFFRSVRLRN